MLDTLKQKLLSWSPEKASQFYAGLDCFVEAEIATWEATPTGFYVISPSLTAYHDYNGMSYYLTYGDATESLAEKQLIADYLETQGSVRIERPSVIQLVTIFNIPFTYSEEVRPFGSHGIPFDNLLLVPPAELRNAAVALSDAVNNSIGKLLKAIDTLSVDNPSLKYQNMLDFFTNFFYDPTNDQYFFAGRIDFVLSREEFKANMNMSADWATYMQNYINKIGGSSLNITADIVNIMENASDVQSFIN